MRWLPGSLARQLSPLPQGAKPNWGGVPSGLVAVIDPFTGANLLAPGAPTITGTRIGPSGIGVSRGYGSTYGVGTTDRIDTSYTLQPTRLSIAFQCVAYSAGSGTANARVVAKGAGTSGSIGTIIFTGTYNPGLSFLYVNTGGSALCDRTFRLPPYGTPMNVVISFGGDNPSTNCWINGQLCDATSISSGQGSAAANSTDPWRIGNRGDGIRCWDGHIGHMFIFGRTLSDIEARNLSANLDRIAGPRGVLWAPNPVGVTVYRPGSDLIVNGWTAVGAGSLAAAMADASNATYAESPNLADPATEAWDAPLPAGTYDISVTFDRTAANGQLRLILLDSGGTTVGTSSWQAAPATFATTVFNVTTTGTSDRFRIEVQP